MKKRCYAKFLLSIAFSMVIGVAAAQDDEPAIAPAIKPGVINSQVMFKKTIWRRMDMTERQNHPFYSMNGDVSTVIIDAAKQGLIFPYESDSCVTRLSMDVFEERIQQEEEEDIGGDDVFGGDDPFAQLDEQQDVETVGPQDIPYSEFNIIQIKEDLYFDRLRSRMYYDIQSLTIYMPAESFYNKAGFQKAIASFKFSELEKLWREIIPEKSIWFNNQNQAAHKNLADAFHLRLFSAPIVKISNATDQSIREIYGQGKRGIIAAQQLEHELVDFENELWEF